MIIADSDFTGEIIELDVTGKYTLGIIDRMRVGKSLFLLEDNAKACIIFDPIYDSKKWMVHILSKKDFRGKELWAFAYSAALWMVEERQMEYMLNLVDHSNRSLRVFVRYFGMPKAADIGDQALYVTSAEQIKNFASQKEV